MAPIAGDRTTGLRMRALPLKLAGTSSFSFQHRENPATISQSLLSSSAIVMRYFSIMCALCIFPLGSSVGNPNDLQFGWVAVDFSTFLIWNPDFTLCSGDLAKCFGGGHLQNVVQVPPPFPTTRPACITTPPVGGCRSGVRTTPSPSGVVRTRSAARGGMSIRHAPCFSRVFRKFLRPHEELRHCIRA